MTQPALAPVSGRPFVTDGGLETDLIFNHGVDLPEFAAFPLLDSESGRRLLVDYYDGYAAIAEAAGAGLLLETPTWRANTDWAARVGYGPADLDRVNADSVALMHEIAARWSDRVAEILVSGMVGPRGDGYRPGAPVTADEAAAYHRPQVAALAAAGADLVNALTLTDVGEAAGIALAARDLGVPVSLSFTVETDGRLPDGMSLADAVAAVDAVCRPDWFLVNCAHPSHVAPGLAEEGGWRDRIVGLRSNASTLTHAELDEATELDDGDPEDLARATDALRPALPNLSVVGGCCGTDARHVAAMWGVSGVLAGA